MISLPNNKGAAHARNIGFAKVETDYVLFYDADDIPLWDNLPKLYSTIDTHKTDIIYFKYKLKGKHGLNSPHKQDDTFYNIYDGLFLNKPSREDKVLLAVAFPWNKAYKTSFLRQHKIEFSDFSVHNDLGFVWKANIIAKTGFVMSETLYIHREYNGEESNSITQINTEKRLQIFNVFREVDRFILQYADSELVLDSWRQFRIDLLFWSKRKISKNLHYNFYHEFRKYKKQLPALIGLFGVEKMLFNKTKQLYFKLLKK